MSKNRTIRGLVAGLVGVAMLLGGIAIASNMGFKFVPNIGASSAFNLSLPWNNNYTKANGLLNDLTGCTKVARYNPTGTLTEWYPSQPTDKNFAIVKGAAYVASAGGSGSNTAVIVGSHDPNYTMSFNANEAFNAAAPYHQTHTKASELYNDLNSQLGSGAATKVARYNSTGTLTEWYPSQSTDKNFALTLGMGVIISTGNGGSGYAWPHY